MGLVTDSVSYYGSGLKALESRMRSLAKKCDLWRKNAIFGDLHTRRIDRLIRH
jgi:hypothetical protein